MKNAGQKAFSDLCKRNNRQILVITRLVMSILWFESPFILHNTLSAWDNVGYCGILWDI